ncbi:MAG: TetR/AcrR family transcriptional regulator [Lachnospiraceae bacterium]|nr:TetR/AcrR family transcriptional regulator [Lachnospiraceae bacterium]
MPPKAKFSREEIVKAALEIARTQGIEAVTARELGRALGSSARPIFTVFQNMDEVLNEVRKGAREIYRQYVERGLSETPAFRGVGLAYIQFAIEEEKLFHLLFMSEQRPVDNIEEILLLIEDSYDAILRSVEDYYHLKREDAKWLYEHLWIYSHGIATLCATGMYDFTPEEIERQLTEIFIGLLKSKS